MPPASKKDCSIILFDLAGNSREKSIQTLLKISSLKHFSESKDLTKLVLLNSEKTENRLNAHYGGYDHIHEVAKDISTFHPTKELEMINTNDKTGKANWLEGLSVALKNLYEEYEPIRGIITLQLLFITDLSTPLGSYDENILHEIVQDINKMDAFVYIVGPDIEAPFTIRSPEDVKSWMDNLQVEQNENLKIAKKIITETEHSVICDYKMGIHLFFSYHKSGGTQPWQVPLSIGTEVNISAQTMRVLKEGMPCKLSSSRRYGDYIWIDPDDESIQYPNEEIRSGIMRHEKFVIIEDNKMFQVENPRSFGILCFTNSCNVPEFLMRGEGCYCVLPKGNPEQIEAMETLIDALAEQNKYAIARRVYNANYAPKIVVLVPKPELNPKCFYLNSLPYAEDIRYNYIEKKLEAAPPIEKVDEVYNFLNSINTDEENGGKKVPLGVKMMVDQNSLKLVNKCCDKLVDKHMGLEDLDMDYISEGFVGGTVDDLKTIWPERTVKEVKKKDEKSDDDSDQDFGW